MKKISSIILCFVLFQLFSCNEKETSSDLFRPKAVCELQIGNRNLYIYKFKQYSVFLQVSGVTYKWEYKMLINERESSYLSLYLTDDQHKYVRYNVDNFYAVYKDVNGVLYNLFGNNNIIDNGYNDFDKCKFKLKFQNSVNNEVIDVNGTINWNYY